MIDDVTICVDGTTFETGKIEWRVHGDEEQSHSTLVNGGKYCDNSRVETIYP